MGNDAVSSSTEPHFPLAPNTDHDYTIGQEYKIGLLSDTPADLRANLAAGIIAFKLGLSSIDYAKRRYTSPALDFTDFDAPLKQAVLGCTGYLEDSYRSFWPRTDTRLATIAFDQALVRATGTLKQAMRLARRGHLFESALVSRGCMEQLAWARSSWNAGTEDDLFAISTHKAVTACKVDYPYFGKLYGILSDYSHFDANLHHWFYAEKDDTVATRFADNQTKIIATSWVFVLADAMVAIFERAYLSRLQSPRVLTRKGNFRQKRFTKANFGVYYHGIESSHLTRILDLFP